MRAQLWGWRRPGSPSPGPDHGDSVLVHAAGVLAPVAVRYAYTANPVGANLYNRDGLPASPFRSDDW